MQLLFNYKETEKYINSLPCGWANGLSDEALMSIYEATIEEAKEILSRK